MSILDLLATTSEGADHSSALGMIFLAAVFFACIESMRKK